MKPTTSDDDFPIHVDGSCLTDSTDLHIIPKRNLSDQTVIHNEDCHEKTEQDEHTEALIHAAARAIITSIEQDAYDKHAGSAISDLSYSGVDGSENCYTEGTELTYGEDTELSYGDGTEMSNDGANENLYDEDIHDDPYDGSASSHNEDDVFSNGRRSSGASLNSSDEQHTDEEMRYQLTKSDNKTGQMEDTPSRHDGQEDDRNYNERNIPETISRIPSIASNAYSMLPEPMSFTFIASPHTPSKVLNRPPFRTPSSVRAIQMSSPTPSIFSGSPTSRKRLNSSRLCTPNKLHSPLSKNKTSAKFKAKEEHPLVLLHVTVLPLQWQHSQLVDTTPTEMLSKDLLAVRESWKLLQEKLGDTVFERGVLLPHPQDSYETLEERLCAALELPMRPRAKILDCGHYVGPSTSFSESELSSADSSDSEDLELELHSSTRSLWCDICCRDVRFGKYDALPGRQKKSFKVKLFASNGLMGAGAWSACWREMERVDVEIVPLVDAIAAKEISELADSANSRRAPETPDEVQVEEEQHSMHEPLPPVKIEVPPVERQTHFDDSTRRERDAERLREIYGEEAPPTPEQTPQSEYDRSFDRRPTARHLQDESFISLLLAAAKVLMRDKKNVIIFLLSLVVVLLAIKPSEPRASRFQMQELAMQKLEQMPVAGIAEPVVPARVEPMENRIQKQDSMQPAAHIEVVEIKHDVPVQAPVQPQMDDKIVQAKHETSVPVPVSEVHIKEAVPRGEGAAAVEDVRQVPVQAPVQHQMDDKIAETKHETSVPVPVSEGHINEAVPRGEEAAVKEIKQVPAIPQVVSIEEPSASSVAEESRADRQIPHIESANATPTTLVAPDEVVASSKPSAEIEEVKPADETLPSQILPEETEESPEPIVHAEPDKPIPKSSNPKVAEAEQVTAVNEEAIPKSSDAIVAEQVTAANEEPIPKSSDPEVVEQASGANEEPVPKSSGPDVMEQASGADEEPKTVIVS